jgi:Polyphosphate kinase
VIELMARFEEEANIELATELQEAGAHVVYGVVGHKTHAKMILVVRREGKQLKRYVHLGTGNYHVRTSRLYTDYSLLTSDSGLGEDVNKLFHQLTGLGRAGRMKKLLQSPFTLQKTMLEHIHYETVSAREGKKARIIAKMNALVDAEIIRALYKASQTGVKIDLIVRGICCLRPGVPGVSENIQVRSIVGRFSGTQPDILLLSWRGGVAFLFQRGLDAAEFLSPDRIVFPDRGETPARADYHTRTVELSFRQYPILVAATGRQL